MRHHHLTFLVTAAIVGIVFTGCETTPEDISELTPEEREALVEESVSMRAILTDLTPELLTMYERHADSEIQINRTFNLNIRQFWQDWGRALLLDRPSRLTRYPVP